MVLKRHLLLEIITIREIIENLPPSWPNLDLGPAWRCSRWNSHGSRVKIWFRIGDAYQDGDLKLHGDFDTITVGRTLDCWYRMYSGSRMIKVKRRTSFRVRHYLMRTWPTMIILIVLPSYSSKETLKWRNWRWLVYDTWRGSGMKVNGWL